MTFLVNYSRIRMHYLVVTQEPGNGELLLVLIREFGMQQPTVTVTMKH